MSTDIARSIERKVHNIISWLEEELGDPIVYVKEKEFFQKILSDNEVVVANFSAPWCNPCKAYLPVFRRVARRYLNRYRGRKLLFIYVDTDSLPDIADKYKVDNIPTTIVFIHGHVADVLVGVSTESRLDERLNAILRELYDNI